jgi:hypothetical protein
MDDNSPVCSQEIIIDTSILDEVWLPVRPVKVGKPLVVEVIVEAIRMKKKIDLPVLLDSGCTHTCIDEEFARSQGWPLEKISHPISIKYADSSVTEKSKSHTLSTCG